MIKKGGCLSIEKEWEKEGDRAPSIPQSLRNKIVSKIFDKHPPPPPVIFIWESPPIGGKLVLYENPQIHGHEQPLDRSTSATFSSWVIPDGMLVGYIENSPKIKVPESE